MKRAVIPSALRASSNMTTRQARAGAVTMAQACEKLYMHLSSATSECEEDDGYVVNFVHDTKDWSSWFCVYDAKDIEQGPIAKVKLPSRVPAGFHATWAPESRQGLRTCLRVASE